MIKIRYFSGFPRQHPFHNLLRSLSSGLMRSSASIQMVPSSFKQAVDVVSKIPFSFSFKFDPVLVPSGTESGNTNRMASFLPASLNWKTISSKGHNHFTSLWPLKWAELIVTVSHRYRRYIPYYTVTKNLCGPYMDEITNKSNLQLLARRRHWIEVYQYWINVLRRLNNNSDIHPKQ